MLAAGDGGGTLLLPPLLAGLGWHIQNETMHTISRQPMQGCAYGTTNLVPVVPMLAAGGGGGTAAATAAASWAGLAHTTDSDRRRGRSSARRRPSTRSSEAES
ncbi:hypothetical protein PF001_g23323 [Phytophthora fragariae]|uniref:Uncharacterized protein n=2 Tax=Phytophthora fragariae TaxID=53985 RepID=A0A6A4C1P9_9STRA|nr:hypothetical protein PF001_g23323 [Phytophthora fragariae]